MPGTGPCFVVLQCLATKDIFFKLVNVFYAASVCHGRMMYSLMGILHRRWFLRESYSVDEVYRMIIVIGPGYM